MLYLRYHFPNVFKRTLKSILLYYYYILFLYISILFRLLLHNFETEDHLNSSLLSSYYRMIWAVKLDKHFWLTQALHNGVTSYECARVISAVHEPWISESGMRILTFPRSVRWSSVHFNVKSILYVSDGLFLFVAATSCYCVYDYLQTLHLKSKSSIFPIVLEIIN